jgi:cytochrome P450
MSSSPDFVDPADLVDPERYARRGYPHDVWTRLRAEAPVAYFAPEGFEPFWAITKHADIVEISKQPLRFSSEPGITLRLAGAAIYASEMVVMLDPPRHGPMRRVINGRFTPRAVRERRDDVERIAVDVMEAGVPAGGTGELDFVERIAAPLPLGVIAWVLGVPRDDWELIFRWTNEIIGKDDAEYRRDGETPEQTSRRARRGVAT